MAEIVVLGEILVEIMATRVGQTFREPGTLVGPYPSGAPAILADQAALAGAAVAMIGCVGPDDFGVLNVERLRRSGADVSGIVTVPGTTTGSAFVTYRADGGRDFVFNIANSASARLGPEHVTAASFAGCRFLHVMGSSLINDSVLAAVRRAVELAKADGAKLSFDPNARRELLALPGVGAAIEELARACDLMLPSEEDLALLRPAMTAVDAAQDLVAKGCERVVIKRGAKGALHVDASGVVESAAFPAEEVDPTGAGDCFGGTFLAALVRGRAITDALRLANAAGSHAVRKTGPMEGNTPLAALETFLASQG